MRPRVLPLVLPLLILTSCAHGPTPGEAVEEIQELYGQSQSMSFSAAVRADYGDRVFDFGLTYSGSRDSGTITLSDPPELAGVTVLLADGGATLEYDGARVYTGELLPDGLSPIDAVPVMLRAFSQGLVTESVYELFRDSDCLMTVFRIDDRVDLRAWFDCQTCLPLRAEFALDGLCVLGFDFDSTELS